MSVQPRVDHDQEMPAPQGRTIGFVETQAECDAVTHALNVAGFPDSALMVLHGEDGIHLFQRMMSGSLWGEETEDCLKQGMKEMSNGHYTLVIDTEDRDEALVAANIAAKHGGHGFSHFGMLADERLTR